MLRVAIAALFVTAGTAMAGAQSAPQPYNPAQTANPAQPGAAAQTGTVWPADNASTTPAPPTFVPNLGSSPNGDALNRAPKVVRVAGGVMATQVVRRVQPVYPSRSDASPGTITLAARVGKDGKVKGVSVISGPPELQKTTVDAVKQWIFRPYLLDGQPVAVETTIALSTNETGGR